MDSPPPESSDLAVASIIARAEQAVTRAGERLLVEQLHGLLDRQGSSAVASLSQTLLPLLQALVLALPVALSEGVSPSVLAAARTLGAALHERGLPLSDLASQGLAVHESMLQEMAEELRAHDRDVVVAVMRISRAILDVERAVLLAYLESAEAAPAHPALTDPATGLAARPYLEERLEDELLIVRERGRPLALLLLTVQPTGATPAAEGEDLAPLAGLLRAQLRSIDLAGRHTDDILAVLLPETDSDGADLFLRRLRRAAGTHEPPFTIRAGVAIAPDQGTVAADLIGAAAEALAHGVGR